jgi:hypothetical protein
MAKEAIDKIDPDNVLGVIIYVAVNDKDAVRPEDVPEGSIAVHKILSTAFPDDAVNLFEMATIMASISGELRMTVLETAKDEMMESIRSGGQTPTPMMQMLVGPERSIDDELQDFMEQVDLSEQPPN